MDDLTAIREFRADRDAEQPEARERAWLALEARMEAAADEARGFGEAVAGSGPPLDAPAAETATGSRPPLDPPPARTDHGFFFRRRRVLAFAAAIVAAAVVAGALVLSSGPTAGRASAAEILREAADAAGGSDSTSSIPGPGQYAFTSIVRLDVEGWISPVPGPGANTGVSQGGAPMKYKNAHNALVTTRIESWLGPDGGGRYRESLGKLTFYNKVEEHRWKAAGSPPPVPYNPEYRRKYSRAFRDALEANSHVVDTTHKGYGKSFHFPHIDTSALPSDPRALREAVETNAIEVHGFNLMYAKEKHLTPEQTKEELVNILFEARPTPELQAAIFDALAELPGIKVVPATDSLGRHGDAIKFAVREGTRWEYLFDPKTSDLLATRGVLVHPGASRSLADLPAGTTVSETDYLSAGIVNSLRERPGGAAAKASGGAASGG
jgi:hypothetical protein